MVYSNKKSGLGKKAIVVSPQSWGKMFISKHHYAVELSKLGYEVFFVNPPKENKLGGLPQIKIEETEYVSDDCKVGAAEAIQDLIPNLDTSLIIVSYNNT